MKKGRQDRIAETLTNVKGWVKGTPFTYKLLIDRIIQGNLRNRGNDLATVLFSATCGAMLSNNSLTTKVV